MKTNMKTIYLIQTALAAATSWATSDGPWGLFAVVDNRHIPLAFPDHSDETLHPLQYSETNHMPTEIFVYANDTAKTSFGFLGVVDDFLVHGPNISGTPLKRNGDNYFISPNFFRCSFPGVRSQLIQTKQDSNCEPVEICLEKFDKDTGKAEEDDIEPERDYVDKDTGKAEEDDDIEPERDYFDPDIDYPKHTHDAPRSNNVPTESENNHQPDVYIPDEHIPHTLFVSGFGLSPLSVARDGRTFQSTMANLRPLRVYYKNHSLFTQDSVTRYLGFEDGKLVQSPNDSSRHQFIIDDRGRIVDQIFSLCETGFHSIQTVNEDNLGCQRVFVYYLPYDRQGNPTNPQNALSELEVYKPQDPQFPFALFAKVEGTYHAVSGSRISNDNDLSGDLVSFVYGFPEPPFEFDLGEHAISSNTINAGYVSFQGNQFGLRYNSSKGSYDLDLDERGRIQNKTFYACNTFSRSDFLIYTRRVSECCCFDAEMYFGKYNKETHEYMEGSFEQHFAPGYGTQPMCA